MPSIEQLRPQEYRPRYGSVHEIEEHKRELTEEQLIVEVAHLRYELGVDTMQLLHDARDERDRSLERLIQLVALSDVPNVEEMVGKDKEALHHVLAILKTYKSKTRH